jgi:UDP-N-acetylglucosamine--N-acetylmuramyl-(pentapeptide) pyrophosphoryl-undecaprenol N-acetylglucosamine transferase
VADARPILIAAGGTGGHIFPGLAVAQALKARGADVVWLGAKGALEERLVPAHNLSVDLLSISALRGKGAKAWLLAPFNLSRALLEALGALRRRRPRAVLALGGFAAGPGGVAAWLLRRPLVVHEQNRVPGLTNRVLSRLATRTLTGFPDAFSPRRRAEFIGNPVRADIAELRPPAERLDGRHGALKLLVLGGSQGARALNRIVPSALAALPSGTVELWHQTGPKHLSEAQAAYAHANVDGRIEPFIKDMAAAYGWADLVICRAGALTLAELCAAGVASLLVPFPHAVDDHQTANARYLVEAGAALLLPEATLDPQTLSTQLLKLHNDRARLKQMAEAARARAEPDAAARCATRLLELAA